MNLLYTCSASVPFLAILIIHAEEEIGCSPRPIIRPEHHVPVTARLVGFLFGAREHLRLELLHQRTERALTANAVAPSNVLSPGNGMN